jgi:hypothetical protein
MQQLPYNESSLGQTELKSDGAERVPTLNCVREAKRRRKWQGFESAHAKVGPIGARPPETALEDRTPASL